MLTPKDCPHEHFFCNVAVSRIERERPEDAMLFQAEVTIRCEDCDTPFRFRGLDMGLDLHGAKVSPDGLEARLAIVPRDDPEPLRGLGAEGFSIKMHGGPEMLTPNEDGLLPCVRCRLLGDSGDNVHKGTWVTAKQVQFHCAECRSAGPRSLAEDEQDAKDGWNRIQRALDWQSKLNESVTMEMIQRALEALDDAERSADREERKLQAFKNLMDHPEWGPPNQQKEDEAE